MKRLRKEKISGNGYYSKLCHKYFNAHLNNQVNLCTTSCTDALEMTAILAEIKPGDDYNAHLHIRFYSKCFYFKRRKSNFVDSRKDHPGMDEALVEEIITVKTKAIVVVHYAGVACDMDKVLEVAKRYNLIVIEDAAQAVDSFYNGKPLGSIGDLGCFSFHETKNIQCGEGGLLSVNNAAYKERAEIIWEKRNQQIRFFGEVTLTSTIGLMLALFLPSEINSAFLYAQLEEIETIQNKRKKYGNNIMKI